MDTKKRVFEMSEEDHKTLLSQMQPQPVMKIGDHWTGDRQGPANEAWKALGAKLGFDWESVEQVPGLSERHFAAIPTAPTASAKVERLNALAMELGEIRAEIDRAGTRAQEILAEIQTIKPE